MWLASCAYTEFYPMTVLPIGTSIPFFSTRRRHTTYREYRSHSLEPFVARRMVEVFCSVILVLSWGVEVRSKSELECRAREAAASVRARHRLLVHSVSAEG